MEKCPFQPQWTLPYFSRIGPENGSKNFASLQVGVPIADKIGQKGSSPFLGSLCTFPNLYKQPGLDPTGLMFL